MVKMKVKSVYEPSGPLGRNVSPAGFCGMKRLGVFLLPPDGMLVYRRVTPALSSLVPIYTPGWGEALMDQVIITRSKMLLDVWFEMSVVRRILLLGPYAVM